MRSKGLIQHLEQKKDFVGHYPLVLQVSYSNFLKKDLFPCHFNLRFQTFVRVPDRRSYSFGNFRFVGIGTLAVEQSPCLVIHRIPRCFPRFFRKKTWVKGKHHIAPRWTFGIRRRGFVSTACSMIGKVEEEPIADPFVIFLILYIYQFHY